MKLAAFCVCTAMCVSAACAAEAPTVAKLYDAQISTAEGEIVSLVEAMPADKFSFVPTNGEFKTVRTFAQQAKHLAAVIYLVSAAARNEKPPVDTGGENGPAAVVSKEQIVKFLKEAFVYAHTAANGLTAGNQTELVKSPFGDGQMARGSCLAIAVSHSFDGCGSHAGQIFENLIEQAVEGCPKRGRGDAQNGD